MPAESDRLFSLAQRLVRSSSPTGETEPALAELEGFLRQAGIPTDRLSTAAGASVLVAGPPPRPGRPTFLLATHVDTVPLPSAPPHPAGLIEEGRLYGRGALDMKGGLALALLLLQEFQRDARFNLGLAVTSDEEAESSGAFALLDRLPASPDLVLVPEPTWERPALSASGRVVFVATFEGKGGHGQELRQGRTPPNPLLALGRFLRELPPSFVPLKAWTDGEGELTLPRRARVRIDHLLPPGTLADDELKALERRVGSVARDYPGLQGSVARAPRSTPWLEAYASDPRQPWVASFLDLSRPTGARPRPLHFDAVGDFNVFGSRFPTVVLGPSGDGAHAEDEWLDLISLERCWHAYRRFLLAVPSEGSPSASAPATAASPRGRGVKG